MLSTSGTAQDGRPLSRRGDPIQGAEALASFGGGFSSRLKARHWTNNLVVEGTSDGAAGKCYLMLFRLGEEGAAPLVTAVYHDELVNGPDGWRFASRKVVGDS